MQEIIFKQEAYDIIGACMEVHKELGAGFLEAVYQEALAREFTTRGIPFEREKQLLIMFKGKPLEKMYAADFICWNKIIVELKSTRDLLLCIPTNPDTYSNNFRTPIPIESGHLFQSKADTLKSERSDAE